MFLRVFGGLKPICKEAALAPSAEGRAELRTGKLGVLARRQPPDVGF